MNERDLETEINSLIHNLNGTSFDQTKNSSTETDLYPIRKQITKLKKELSVTHGMFVNAKNLLSSISFKNVDENFVNEVSSIGEKCQQMLNDQCDDDNFFDNLCQIIHQCHDIPELHTIATAVNELKCGISKMENNHLLLDDLYEDVWKSVACSDSDNVFIIPQNLEENSTGRILDSVEDVNENLDS